MNPQKLNNHVKPWRIKIIKQLYKLTKNRKFKIMREWSSILTCIWIILITWWCVIRGCGVMVESVDVGVATNDALKSEQAPPSSDLNWHQRATARLRLQASTFILKVLLTLYRCQTLDGCSFHCAGCRRGGRRVHYPRDLRTCVLCSSATLHMYLLFVTVQGVHWVSPLTELPNELNSYLCN